MEQKLHKASKQNQRVFTQNRNCKNVNLNRKSIFFLCSESRRSRLTRVPYWCERFCYAIKVCSAKTTFRNVKVNIVDEYHRGMYITPMKVDKIAIMQTHPAVYQITVEYNSMKYTISGSDTYNKYKDKVGQTATGTLEIRNYDDGTTRYDIISLE